MITATQMLLSMTENIRPTRAEVSDVANAILDGTDAIMLSEETAIGRYPVEVVEMISMIAMSTERERRAIKALADLPAYFRTSEVSCSSTVDDIVSLNAIEAADALNVRYILTDTKGRKTPSLISRFKPDCWILSCGNEDFLALSYGAYPLIDVEVNGRANMTIQSLVKTGMVEKDERVILIEDESVSDMNEATSLTIFRS